MMSGNLKKTFSRSPPLPLFVQYKKFFCEAQVNCAVVLVRLSDELSIFQEQWYKNKEYPKLKQGKQIEKIVTGKLISDFSFCFIETKSAEELNRLEELFIGLFSSFPIMEPSENWLGKKAYEEKVRKSGLWNVYHVKERGQFCFNADERKAIIDLFNNQS